MRVAGSCARLPSDGFICMWKRVGGGMHVTLYWNPTDNTTSIEVWQPTSDERLAYAVPRERALDAFYHPFAHLLPAVDEAA